MYPLRPANPAVSGCESNCHRAALHQPGAVNPFVSVGEPSSAPSIGEKIVKKQRKPVDKEQVRCYLMYSVLAL